MYSLTDRLQSAISAYQALGCFVFNDETTSKVRAYVADWKVDELPRFLGPHIHVSIKKVLEIILCFLMSLWLNVKKLKYRCVGSKRA